LLSSYISNYIRSSREDHEEFRVHVHKLFDRIGRSPIHVAVSAGLSRVLHDLLDEDLLTDEEKKNTFNNGGLDGMTPLHLAVKSENMPLFDTIAQQALHFRSITTTDAWGREALETPI